MKKTNIAKLKWKHWKSPKGTVDQYSKDISASLGDVLRGWPKKGHPFNLELARLPPGKAASVFHSHTTQWELYVIVSGTGVMRAGKTRHKVKAEDTMMLAPGDAHQLINTGKEDLVYYLIADNPPVDIFHYPDSDKWGFRPPGKFFKMTEQPYYQGEE